MNDNTTQWKRVLWIVAGLGFLAGLYGLVDRLTAGHAHAAYGSYVPWGLWVAAYTTLVGVSAGAFVLAAVVFLSKREEWLPLGRTALLVALAALAGGMLSILLDLGHPERFWRLFFSTNFTSIMGLMNWLYTLYGLILLLMIWLSWRDAGSRWLRNLSLLAIPFAVIFSGAEGALFGVVGARPAWESGLTPLLFLLEGALSGVASVIVGSYVLGQLSQEKAWLLGRALLVLLVLAVLFEWAEKSTAFYAGIPAKAAALRAVLFGPYWWVFWFVHLGAGILVPLILLALRARQRPVIALSGLLVVLAAVATKLNLVIPALAQEELEGLANAFTGPGLTFSYFPTLPEWMLFVWTASLALLIFLGGTQWLPRLRKEAY